MDMMMQVYQEDFFSLETQWRKLTASDDHCTIFQSWEWISEWLENFGTSYEIKILCARDSGAAEIRGILPLMRLHKSVEWRFLGDTAEICPDHLDIISDPSDKMYVCMYFLEFMGHAPGIRVCNFDHVSHRSPLRNVKVSDNRFWMMTSVSCKYLLLSLSGGWSEIEKGLSKKFRKSIPYQERRLRKEFDVELALATSENNIDVFRKMVELHTARWNQLNQGGAFMKEEVRKFHEGLIKKTSPNRECILAYLKINDDIIAVIYGFAYKNVFYFYNSGFDSTYSKYSPGIVTLAFTIKAAIEAGCTSFDFLRGNEGYKDKWPGTNLYDFNIRLHKKSISGVIQIAKLRLENALDELIENCKNIIRRTRRIYKRNN